jgi:hypothetical protein
MCVNNEPKKQDEELIDTLIAISILSKRLAEKLREEEKNEQTVTDPG